VKPKLGNKRKKNSSSPGFKVTKKKSNSKLETVKFFSYKVSKRKYFNNLISFCNIY
jgi:hypothetical protein